jgi:RNA polymerase sigma-70 factor (ECF subfamily)
MTDKPLDPSLETEVEIVQAAVAGDSDAFSTLYERYVTRIYNYIYYRTGHRHEAEDLTERVFYRALRRISYYQNQGVPFSAWLYRIAHNLVANWYRDQARRKEVALEDHLSFVERPDYPEASLLVGQEKDLMMRAIRLLPPDRQQLLILKFVENLSNIEVAQIMRRSEGAIKSLYHRTLIALRELIKSIENSGPPEQG